MRKGGKYSEERQERKNGVKIEERSVGELSYS